MAVPERHEEHVISCALCGWSQVVTSFKEVSTWASDHMRKEHQKYAAYAPDAVKSVTVMYEGEDVNGPVQDPDCLNPMSQFLKVLSWLTTRDM